MNTQNRTPVDYKNPLLDVEEIFYTIQGEGPLTGRPAVFIRLSGCNLRCKMCVVGTTQIATPGKKKRIDQIEIGDEILAYNESTMKIEKSKVLHTMENTVTSLLKIKFDGVNSLYITPEHPVYVIKRGWVEAKDLVVGDVVFHTVASDRMKLQNPSFDPNNVYKGLATKRENGTFEKVGEKRSQWSKDNPEAMQRVSERMKANNPMKDVKVREKSWTNRKHTISMLEQLVLRIIQDNELPIEFVGDGSFWVEGKCPDFKVIGVNKVIEVWDRSHEKFMGRDETYISERTIHFKEHGYDSLFLPYHPSDFRNLGDEKGVGKANGERWLLQRLVEFVHNGNVVQSIERIDRETNPKAYTRLAGTLQAPIKVYNLEVEGNHNYFANQILVHNCDTFYNSFHLMSVSDAVKQAVSIQNKARICVITGGEPFRQYQLAPLIEALLQWFLTVQIETSGSCYQPTFTAVKSEWGGRIMVVCSPKTIKLHPMILEHIDAYKYVVRFGHVDEDGLPNEEPQNHIQVPVAKPHNKNLPVYISPWDEKELEQNALNTQQAVDSCLQHGYYLSLQVHKIVNLA